jgi:hypothetical protein
MADWKQLRNIVIFTTFASVFNHKIKEGIHV